MQRELVLVLELVSAFRLAFLLPTPTGKGRDVRDDLNREGREGGREGGRLGSVKP